MTVFPPSFNLLVYTSYWLFLPLNFKNDPIICSHFQDQFLILLKPSKIQMFQKQEIEREKGLHLTISFLLSIYPTSFINNRCQTYIASPLQNVDYQHFAFTTSYYLMPCLVKDPPSPNVWRKVCKNEFLSQKLGFG